MAGIINLLSPDNRCDASTDDGSHRITQTQDNLSRTVEYARR